MSLPGEGNSIDPPPVMETAQLSLIKNAVTFERGFFSSTIDPVHIRFSHKL